MQDQKILKDLEKGIDLLLDQMPDYVAQLLDEIAAQGSIPRWQLVGGILFEAYNNGYLSAYTLDPAWKDGFKPEESVCKFCGEKFQPVRIGQLFCDNDCGQGIKVLEPKESEKEPKKESPSGKPNSILANLAKSKSDKRVHDIATEKSKTGKTGKAGEKESGWTDQPLPAA